MRKIRYIKALFSPFKPFKLKWYFGKVKIGTPYFLPRRWVKNPNKKGYLKSIPKKIGFDIVPLGWKDKFGKPRFESAPLLSFVFFKWQIAITISAPHQDHYWESWVYYEYYTDKSLSKSERILKCIKEAPQTWKSYKDGKSVTTDYYDLILRKKYRPKSLSEIREERFKKILEHKGK